MHNTKKCILLFFLSQANLFCRSYTNTIDLPENDSKMTRLGMTYIQSSLEKSRYDSVQIFSRLVKDKIDTELLYSPHLNRDSILQVTKIDSSLWDSFLPFKQLSVANDGTYILNGRYIGVSFLEFKSKVMACKELLSLNKRERAQFANYFHALNQLNIWDCIDYKFQDNSKIYLFTYSKENLYISSRAQRYLVVKSTADINLLRQSFEILDERDGLLLVKDKID